MPVGRSKVTELEPPEERLSVAPIPAESTARIALHEREHDEEEEERTGRRVDEPDKGRDPARATGEAAAAATFGEEVTQHQSGYPGSQSAAGGGGGGKSALIMYDYEKAEGNEIDLQEGEYVTNIEMVDDDWWMGQNAKGEMGLFPSNYVELVDDLGDDHDEPGQAGKHRDDIMRPADENEDDDDGDEVEATTGPASALGQAPARTTAAAATAADDDDEEVAPGQGSTATALYDYEAAEPNELTFNEGAKITGIVSSLLSPFLIVIVTITSSCYAPLTPSSIFPTLYLTPQSSTTSPTSRNTTSNGVVMEIK